MLFSTLCQAPDNNSSVHRWGSSGYPVGKKNNDCVFKIIYVTMFQGVCLIVTSSFAAANSTHQGQEAVASASASNRKWVVVEIQIKQTSNQPFLCHFSLSVFSHSEELWCVRDNIRTINHDPFIWRLVRTSSVKEAWDRRVSGHSSNSDRKK